MELARAQGLQVEELELAPEQLLESDELFLTNSIFGIWPVRQLDELRLTPGVITKRLMHALDETAGA